MSVGFMLASSALVGSIPAAVGAGLASPAGRTLLGLLLLTAVLYLLQGTVSPLVNVVTRSLGRRVETALANQVMGDCTAPAGIAHLEDPTALNLIAQAQGVGHQGFGPAAAASAFFDLLATRLPGYFSVLILVTYNPLVAIGYLLFLYWMRASSRREVNRSLQAQLGQSEALRRAHYYRDLALAGGAAKELRIFGLGDWARDRFTHYWHEAMAALWSIRAEGFTDQVRTTGGLFVAEGLTYALIARSAAVGSITVGQLALYIQAVAAARLGILLFGNPDLLITYGSASVPAARGLRSSLARLPSGLAASAGAPVERRLPGRAIEFAGVSFRYPGEDLPLVLSELELTLEANRSHAIVGVNGAGKTTLLKLLCRFYDPTAGRVLVDGIDLKDIDPGAWQRNVAAIFQDFVRYELSAADNVGFGHLPSLDDQAALDKAAVKAGAQGVVDRLPGQWETPLARHLTGGADLSGGEWQRIALARAMMAAGGGAGLLILDEPTASLDARGEAEIFDRFLEITEGCTTLLVSHRFSTVRRAEVIHVLDSGRVVEEGSHAALMELGGRYARMFGLQAARFKAQAESVERAGSHE